MRLALLALLLSLLALLFGALHGVNLFAQLAGLLLFLLSCLFLFAPTAFLVFASALGFLRLALFAFLFCLLAFLLRLFHVGNFFAQLAGFGFGPSAVLLHAKTLLLLFVAAACLFLLSATLLFGAAATLFFFALNACQLLTQLTLGLVEVVIAPRTASGRCDINVWSGLRHWLLGLLVAHGLGRDG